METAPDYQVMTNTRQWYTSERPRASAWQPPTAWLNGSNGFSSDSSRKSFESFNKSMHRLYRKLAPTGALACHCAGERYGRWLVSFLLLGKPVGTSEGKVLFHTHLALHHRWKLTSVWPKFRLRSSHRHAGRPVTPIHVSRKANQRPEKRWYRRHIRAPE